MKKILTTLFALSVCSSPNYADKKTENTKTENTKPLAVLTLNSSKNKKIVTYGEFNEMLLQLMASFKESGQTLPADKQIAVEKMTQTYLIADAALLLVAMESNIKDAQEVKDQIQRATEKIIKDAYQNAEKKKLQEKLAKSEFEAMYKEFAAAIIAEKGDQLILSVFSLQQSTDAPRIIKKITSINSQDAKAKEWSKLVKNSAGEHKTLDPMLLSDVPNILKTKLENCKTGDVVSISIPDAKDPKLSKVVLFFVIKREKINGALLDQEVVSKIKEYLSKQFDDYINSQVSIEKFDEKGQKIIAESPTAKSPTAKSVAVG